jgi:hypothetical protein
MCTELWKEAVIVLSNSDVTYYLNHPSCYPDTETTELVAGLVKLQVVSGLVKSSVGRARKK